MCTDDSTHFLRQAIYTVAAAVVFSMVFPTNARALSCAPRIFTLSEAFEAADSIIVGLVTECKEEISSDPWANGGSDCSFVSLEVLKESKAERDYGGVASSSGCGLSLFVGKQYLLFLDSENRPMYFSASLDGDQNLTQISSNYERILREFRDGVIHDLSGPWTFYDSGLGCEVRHRFSGASIAISFQYRDPEFWDDDLVGLEGIGPRGEALFRTETSRDELHRVQANTTYEYDGPDFERETIFVRVIIENRENRSDGIVSLSIGKRAWQLEPMTATTSGSAVSTRVRVYDMLGGHDALSLFHELTQESKEISLITSQLNAAVDLNYPKMIKTRSTQFAHSLGSFNKCVSGERRRGAIITRQ